MLAINNSTPNLPLANHIAPRRDGILHKWQANTTHVSVKWGDAGGARRERRIKGPISHYKNNRGGNNNICTRRNQICIWQTRCRREGHRNPSNKRSILNLNIFPFFLAKSVLVITLILQEILNLQSIVIYWLYSCAIVENKQDLYTLLVEASLSIHNMQILRPSSRMLYILTHSQRAGDLWFRAILICKSLCEFNSLCCY